VACLFAFLTPQITPLIKSYVFLQTFLNIYIRDSVRRFLSVGFFVKYVAPPGPFRGTPGRFQFLPKICRVIRIWNCFHGVRYTWESIKRRTFRKILSSYSPFYMIKVLSSGRFLKKCSFKSCGSLNLFNSCQSVHLTPRSHHSAVHLTLPRLFWFLLCNSTV